MAKFIVHTTNRSSYKATVRKFTARKSQIRLAIFSPKETRKA